MAKGIKKIRYESGLVFPKLSAPNSTLVVQPEQYVWFVVSEWLPGTTAEDKKKDIVWMRQTKDRKIILNQMTLPSSNKYGVRITKKLSGPVFYYVEASLSGKRDSSFAGLFIRGACPPKIISSKWAKSFNGANIKNQSGVVKYGETVHLHLETEGLNGEVFIVEVYNQVRIFDDTPIRVYTNVECIDGEVNLEITDTFTWMAKVKNIQSSEQFYVKVKDKNGHYLKDTRNQEPHGVYLNIENKVATTAVTLPKNNKPAKVGATSVNSQRYEPCKFNSIDVTEVKTENGLSTPLKTILFDEGQNKMKNTSPVDQLITRSVFFDFDKSAIRSDAKSILPNILQFLLGHKDSIIHLDAHADDRGSDEYNIELSQKRAEVIKKYFVDNGLDASRMRPVGHGERDLKVKGDHLTEPQHQQNRRTDISFVFKGHGANSIIYETTGPSFGTKKDLIMVINGFDTKKCFTHMHDPSKKVVFRSIGQELDKGDKPKIHHLDGSNTIVEEIYSDLSKYNAAPIQYIWPSGTTPNQFWYYINSCRYYAEDKRPTVIIKVYPDIKWEIAIEFQVQASNYKAANMPAGSTYEKHNEKAREAGYKRWLMNKQGEVPITIGFGLSAEWDAAKTKRSLTNEFEGKIEKFAKTISTIIGVLQNAINYTQSVAKSTSIPVGFNIRYPKIGAKAAWYLESSNKPNTKIAIVGELGFTAKPLFGASVLIDIIGCAIAAASYAGTGNPAAARIITNFRGTMEKLGSSVTFTAEFTGDLEVSFDALEINSIKGIGVKGKTTIGGKMGVTVKFLLESDLGKVAGRKKQKIIKFSALAVADASFGGDWVIDSDDKGMFVQPIIKFSGLVLSAEIEGEVGWWKSNFKIEKKVIDEEVLPLDKHYFINK